MSYTEIYKFGKDGSAGQVGETRNAFRGAMSIWGILEEKYLPPHKTAWSMPGEKVSRVADMMNRNAMKEIWGLIDNPDISEVDKIVLASTFDNVIVSKENIPKLLDAFRSFEGNTSLKEQAEVIVSAISEDPELIAIAWNQTSVNGDAWESEETGEDEDGEEYYLPYNLNNSDKHWELFENLKTHIS